MKILLTGAAGQLGSECADVLKHDYEIIAPTKEELDITSWDKVITSINHLSPDIILNCAAFSRVDECELEKTESEKINVEGARNLAQGAARYNKIMVHISSDFVFNGRKRLPQPYFEDDSMNPLSFYGLTKMESEMAVKQNTPQYIIVRTGWLYSIKGDSFVKKILRLALEKKLKSLSVVNDQFGSPTWTYRLALQIQELIRHDAKGTYHATSEGYCTPFEFAAFILSKLGIAFPIEACPFYEYPQRAKRPVNCILENRFLKKQGVNVMREWDKDVDSFLEQFGKALIAEATKGMQPR